MTEDPLRWLYGLERFGIKLGLDAARGLLAALGNPEASFPSVLVGGTNGKGSVAAMLDAMLARTGRRVGLYTSPHLVRPNERIRIGGADISSADLGSQLRAVREAIGKGLAAGELAAHPSFFEVLTATAFLAFRDAAVDVAVLEVGLGGRLDATNVVDAAASVIVSVDLDHTDRLGSSLEEIAREKAGIVRPGRPLVSGVGQPEALAVLRETCASLGARMIESRLGAELTDHGGGAFGVMTGRARYEGLRSALPGRHQMENARVAVLALEELCAELGWTHGTAAVRDGLAAVRWPGRLQWIPSSPPVLLDGAHNPAGARALAEHIRTLPTGPPVLVFASMKDKDAASILAILAERVRAVVLTRPRVERASDPQALAALVPTGIPREAILESGVALDRARELTGPDGFVLVAGSLYLVGEILASLEAGDALGPVAM